MITGSLVMVSPVISTITILIDVKKNSAKNLGDSHDKLLNFQDAPRFLGLFS